jgi:glycerophosphoryl diester phosphodiesterase
VEVKCGKEIIPHLVEEIAKSKLKTEQVVLICFKQEVVRAFKKAMPKNKAYWLSGFKKNEEGVWKPTLETVLATLKDTKADGLDSHHGIPSADAKKIMKEGFEWHAWTINDIATAKKLKALGLHSITTDRPGLIKSSL